MKILGAALIGEVIILAIFDLVVFGSGGSEADGIQFESLNMFQLTDPGVGLAAGVGLFLAFWSWVGFEAVPNYAEESKDPARIVPRATLISVVGLGIGYVITSLAFVSAFPEATLVKDAQNPDGPFFLAMEQYGNEFLKTLMQVLILTGAFACAMAFHNVAMRYFYAMGREGILPRSFGRTHPKHRSPYIASIAQTVFALVLVLAWGIGAGFSLRRRVRHRLRPRLHDDGRPGRGVAPRDPGRLRAGRAGVAPAPQAPRLVGGRDALPDHRDHRPGVRDLPAVREHRHAGRHDRLRRPDRTDRGPRRRRRLVYALVLKRRDRKKFDMIGRMIDEGVTAPPS